jgi:hypothetical protein
LVDLGYGRPVALGDGGGEGHYREDGDQDDAHADEQLVEADGRHGRRLVLVLPVSCAPECRDLGRDIRLVGLDQAGLELPGEGRAVQA